MCNFWNKHSCVCFSKQRSRQQQPARSVQLEPRTLGWMPSGSRKRPSRRPPGAACHPGRSVWRPIWGPLGSLQRDYEGAGVPGGEASVQKPLEVLSLWNECRSQWAGRLASELLAVEGSSLVGRSMWKDPARVRGQPRNFLDRKTEVQGGGMGRRGQGIPFIQPLHYARP